MTAEELLNKIRTALKSEGLEAEMATADPELLVTKYAIPALNNLKDIQSSLYTDYYLDESGLQRKLKNKVIRKLSNVTRNTVEMPLMRQQKFNDNVTAVLEYLISENAKLRAEIAQLKGRA